MSEPFFTERISVAITPSQKLWLEAVTKEEPTWDSESNVMRVALERLQNVYEEGWRPNR